jgi:hypothetical protein
MAECIKALGKGIFFHGGPVWEPGRGLLSWAFERQVQVCFGHGASLSMGALRGEPGRGAPLLGFLNYTCRRPW